MLPAHESVPHIVVVGGGVAGLSSAIDLARAGLRVTLCERHAKLGGKLRTVLVEGRAIDAGPTVMTMRHVFDGLFADAGTRLDDWVTLSQSQVLARHSWGDGTQLDLYADPERSRAAIRDVFGEDQAKAFDNFTLSCRSIYEEVEGVFIFAQRPSPLDVARSYGLSALSRLARIDAHRTMWTAVSRAFSEPRLRQLFGRYATYTGASPFQAPATLNLVAHVELAGVWTVNGGMSALGVALAGLATQLGVRLRTDCGIHRIEADKGHVMAVHTDAGERMSADAVIFNGDISALGTGLLGPDAVAAVAATPPGRRSLSALTIATVARPAGRSLVHHNVFFSDDYRAEFAAIFRHGRLPEDPTVYVCAQDRTDGSPAAAPTRERLFMIVNAPARGDRDPIPKAQVEACTARTLQRLERCGLTLEQPANTPVITRPQDWEALFPATGGALYGPAAHGWSSGLQRSGARSKLAGLYLAGGSVHPGAGVPMVALSGRLAAARVVEDLHWTGRSLPVATPGGTSTSSPPTARPA